LLVIAGLPLLSRAASPLSLSRSHVPELTLSADWAAGLFAVWALIATVLLIRLALSMRHISALRRGSCEIDRNLYSGLIELTNSFAEQQSRRVKLLVSDDVRIPTALGFFTPAIVLPSWTLRDLSQAELGVIVLHELAHLRRRDDWTNLAQQFVKALFFFHPAVWWIDRRLALEREIACDDMVLEQTVNARIYAASLVSIAEKFAAEKMRMGRAIALAQSALGQLKEVSQRISQILDTKRERRNGGLKPALAMIGTLSVVTLAAMPYAPELISFQNKTQPVFSATAERVTSLPIKATPVTLKQPVNRTARDLERSAIARRNLRPDVIPAKAPLHGRNRTPKVMMAKAFDRSAPAETLLLWHSSQSDEPDSTVWTVTVWRVSSAYGGQQMIQETIVMNSL
jgi:beta-lactamase regulating signal transducer with metallopeptidase domain